MFVSGIAKNKRKYGIHKLFTQLCVFFKFWGLFENNLVELKLTHHTNRNYQSILNPLGSAEIFYRKFCLVWIFSFSVPNNIFEGFASVSELRCSSSFGWDCVMSLSFTEQVWVNSSVNKKKTTKSVPSELYSETAQCPVLQFLKLPVSKAKPVLQDHQPETTDPFSPGPWE